MSDFLPIPSMKSSPETTRQQRAEKSFKYTVASGATGVGTAAAMVLSVVDITSPATVAVGLVAAPLLWYKSRKVLEVED